MWVWALQFELDPWETGAKAAFKVDNISIQWNMKSVGDSGGR